MGATGELEQCREEAAQALREAQLKHQAEITQRRDEENAREKQLREELEEARSQAVQEQELETRRKCQREHDQHMEAVVRNLEVEQEQRLQATTRELQHCHQAELATSHTAIRCPQANAEREDLIAKLRKAAALQVDSQRNMSLADKRIAELKSDLNKATETNSWLEQQVGTVPDYAPAGSYSAREDLLQKEKELKTVHAENRSLTKRVNINAEQQVVELHKEIEHMQLQRGQEMTSLESKMQEIMAKKDNSIRHLQVQLKAAHEEHVRVQAMLSDAQA
eukprot:scaffold1106_cov608-Prasinococcus_capsulatus_cf.AAC.8